MKHLCAGSSENVQLLLIHMDAVRERDVRRGQTERGEVFDVSHARRPLDHFDLGTILGSVRMHKHAAFTRESSNLFE